jgi:hypothetical protein
MFYVEQCPKLPASEGLGPSSLECSTWNTSYLRRCPARAAPARLGAGLCSTWNIVGLEVSPDQRASGFGRRDVHVEHPTAVFGVVGGSECSTWNTAAGARLGLQAFSKWNIDLHEPGLGLSRSRLFYVEHSRRTPVHAVRANGAYAAGMRLPNVPRGTFVEWGPAWLMRQRGRG